MLRHLGSHLSARISRRVAAHVRHIAPLSAATTAVSAAAFARFTSSSAPSQEQTTIESCRLASPAVSLSFAPPGATPFPSCGSTNAPRPLRIAVASSGLSKKHFDYKAQTWSLPPGPLPNFAAHGEDVAGLVGEDAVGFAHASPSYRLPSLPAAQAGPQCTEVVDSSKIKPLDYPYTKLSPPPSAALAHAAGFAPSPVLRETAHPVSAVALSIADGVGGMAGVRGNDTSLMSHELMRNVRRVLRPDSDNAKEVLSDAWALLNAEGKPRVGACTAITALITPLPPKPASPTAAAAATTAGAPSAAERLRFHFANLGDSTVMAFRPLIYVPAPAAAASASASGSGAGAGAGKDDAPQSCDHAVPLAMSWGMDYGIQGSNTTATPVQLFTQRGSKPMFDLFPEDMGIDSFSDGAQPWMASEGSAALQRGDIIVLMTDGVSENLSRPEDLHPNKLMPIYAQVVSATVGAGAWGAHPATKHALFGSGAAAHRAEAQEKALTCEAECAAAGTFAELMAGALVRASVGAFRKVDDISVVVGFVY